MDLKQIIDLVLTIIGILLVVVPYIATMLIHTRNKYLMTIGNEAIKTPCHNRNFFVLNIELTFNDFHNFSL